MSHLTVLPLSRLWELLQQWAHLHQAVTWGFKFFKSLPFSLSFVYHYVLCHHRITHRSASSRFPVLHAGSLCFILYSLSFLLSLLSYLAMDDDSDNVLSYSHQINLEDFCSNLISAHAYTARYLENEVMYTISHNEIVWAIEKVHPYLVRVVLFSFLHWSFLNSRALYRMHTTTPCENSSCWILVMVLRSMAKLAGWCAVFLQTFMKTNGDRWLLTAKEHQRNSVSLHSSSCSS